jgi:hypothetical protein
MTPREYCAGFCSTKISYKILAGGKRHYKNISVTANGEGTL